MEKGFFFLLLIVCFSCDKKESTSNILFKNHLKQTIGLYQNLGNVAELELQQREADEGRKRKGSDGLQLIQARFKAEFEKAKITDVPELLKIQSRIYTEFNALFPYHSKYGFKAANDLTSLNVEVLKLYVECDFYKTQYENLEYHGRQWIVKDGFYGYHKVTPSQMKQFEEIEKAQNILLDEIAKKGKSN
jgi:hypothetical protein